ncbi:MAG: hypothetical protein JXR77_01160 [Lentisphaeria bacterium]|nr:hypothetical protein [Lentisphaeria bacterium]
MFEFAKKGIYVGLGLASFTKEKAEAFAKEFAKRAKVSEDEGRRFAEYLSAESRKAQKGLRESVETMVQKAVDRVPFKRRLEALEARVALLEQLALDLCPEKAEELGLKVTPPVEEPASEETGPTEEPAP